MEYCASRGIPHSRFKGWAPHDQDAALSWLVWSREACPSCGTRADEWNPDKGGHLQAYEAVRQTCQGCSVKGRAEERLAADKKVRPGTSIVLVPTAEVPVATQGAS